MADGQLYIRGTRVVDRSMGPATQSENGIMSANDKIIVDNILGDLAEVELGSVATKEYVVDDRVVFNKQYYKVKAPISIGNAFVVDGNIEKTTVGDDITSLKSDLAKDFIKVQNWTHVHWEATLNQGQTFIQQTIANIPDTASRVVVSFGHAGTIAAVLELVRGAGSVAIDLSLNRAQIVWNDDAKTVGIGYVHMEIAGGVNCNVYYI